MTNKEAIMILESVQPSCGEKYSYSESEIYEAIDMAISALAEQRWIPVGRINGKTVYAEALQTAIKALEEPPEIIRCKDCKFTDGTGAIADGRYWCVINSCFMYFCSDAERKEK